MIVAEESQMTNSQKSISSIKDSEEIGITPSSPGPEFAI